MASTVAIVGAGRRAASTVWSLQIRVVLYRQYCAHDSMVLWARNTYRDKGGQQSARVVRDRAQSVDRGLGSNGTGNRPKHLARDLFHGKRGELHQRYREVRKTS
jgi:hypothetical protein